jgi:hypothetical protein
LTITGQNDFSRILNLTGASFQIWEEIVHGSFTFALPLFPLIPTPLPSPSARFPSHPSPFSKNSFLLRSGIPLGGKTQAEVVVFPSGEAYYRDAVPEGACVLTMQKNFTSLL